jgi:pyruvate dehydrogenase phosphatase regulatory subunit
VAFQNIQISLNKFLRYIFVYFCFIIRLGGGTTWHASGLVGAFKPSLAQVKLAQDSIALYKELEKRGLSTGWKQCGSLSLARTRDRMASFRRMKAQSV